MSVILDHTYCACSKKEFNQIYETVVFKSKTSLNLKQ